MWITLDITLMLPTTVARVGADSCPIYDAIFFDLGLPHIDDGIYADSCATRVVILTHVFLL